MKGAIIRRLAARAALGLLLIGPMASAVDIPSVPLSEIDALFTTWTNATPGCAVGVSAGGRIVLEKAFGMADLEHDVPNTPDTIFEAGSVSKQFTAMAVLLLARDGHALRLGDDTLLVPLSPLRFTDRDGTFIEFEGHGMATLDVGIGALIPFEKVTQAQPTAAALAALTGTYTSDDAEVTLRAELRDGVLELRRRPDSVFPLTPLYADAFDSELGTIIFRRDDAGNPVEFSVVQDRVWDLRFLRDAEASAVAVQNIQ